MSDKDLKALLEFLAKYSKELKAVLILYGVKDEYEFFSGNFSKMQKDKDRKRAVNQQLD